MPDFKWFASLVLSAVPALTAATHCPGNVASLPFRLSNSHQMIVAVSVNHSGPYNFLLDIGTQITTVDPYLAADLHLEPHGAAVVAGVGTRQSAWMAQLDLLEAGSRAVPNQKVLVYDLRNLHIQGILGEDFLEHFDMLIDNVHGLLCLDNSSAMRADVKGPHTALVTPKEVADGVELPNLIIMQARLSDASRPVRLMLDSGANGAVLFNTAEYLGSPHRRYLQGTGVDGRQRIFSVLPPQDVKIGSLKLSRVPFVSLAGTQKDSRAKGFDGVLTLGLFRRVFIAHADHFAVLEPK
jgi:aspartyl protease